MLMATLSGCEESFLVQGIANELLCHVTVFSFNGELWAGILSQIKIIFRKVAFVRLFDKATEINL